MTLLAYTDDELLSELGRRLKLDGSLPQPSHLMEIANELDRLGFDRFRINGNNLICEALAWKKSETQSSIEVSAASIEIALERLMFAARVYINGGGMEETITGEELLKGLQQLEKSPLNSEPANRLLDKAVEQRKKGKIGETVFWHIINEHMKFPQLMVGKVER